MAHQAALTLVAEVRPEAADDVRRLLATMGNGVSNGQVVDFSRLPNLHFARFVLVEESTDLEGELLPPSLLYLSDFDGSKSDHLAGLVHVAGDGIDRLFGHCVGYPQPATREQRLAYLQAHTIKEQARYVNTIGRPATQIRQEAELRERIESHLQAHGEELRGQEPVKIRQALRQLVESDEGLAWARRPAEGKGLGFRLRESARAIGVGLLVLLLLPLLLVALPFYLVLLRRHERRDPAPHLKPSPGLVQDLAALEDHGVQNPFTAIGLVKPSRFRRLTARVVLAGIDVAARHVFNRGNLAGVKTIHFARWVFLDDGRRVMFASNYDGSLENYMNDFIDKIAWGLNIVFSNGYGYPRTRFLILDGARDELAFKDYLRLHQVPTFVWHSAYDRLTTANIANNARIRAGLQGEASPREAGRWLQTL